MTPWFRTSGLGLGLAGYLVIRAMTHRLVLVVAFLRSTCLTLQLCSLGPNRRVSQPPGPMFLLRGKGSKSSVDDTGWQRNRHTKNVPSSGRESVRIVIFQPGSPSRGGFGLGKHENPPRETLLRNMSAATFYGPFTVLMKFPRPNSFSMVTLTVETLNFEQSKEVLVSSEECGEDGGWWGLPRFAAHVSG